MGTGVKGFKPLKSEKGKSKKQITESSVRRTKSVDVLKRKYFLSVSDGVLYSVCQLQTYKLYGGSEVKDERVELIFPITSSWKEVNPNPTPEEMLVIGNPYKPSQIAINSKMWVEIDYPFDLPNPQPVSSEIIEEKESEEEEDFLTSLFG